MSKKMCNLRKNGEERKVRNPKYECKTCSEKAAKENHLCKPTKQ